MRWDSTTSVVVVVRAAAGQPGGQPLDRHLELRVRVDEGLQLVGQPGERDLLLAPPAGQLLDAAVSEVHDCRLTTWSARRLSPRRPAPPARAARPRAPSPSRRPGWPRPCARPGAGCGRRAAPRAG